jgi:hypothetical protein
LPRLADALARQADATIPDATGSRGQACVAYRFLAHTTFTPDGAVDSRAALDTEHVAKAIKAAGPSGFDKSPEDVAGVIARMCHPEPGERYQRMEEVKDDLAIIGQ